MRLSMMVLSVILAVLSFLAFCVPTGRWTYVVQVGVLLVAVVQVIFQYLMTKSVARNRAEARLEFNDVLAPLLASLKNLPLLTPAKRQEPLVDFLRFATAASIELASGPKLRATFFEVKVTSGTRAFVPTNLTFGRGDSPESVFEEGDSGEGEDVWSRARLGRERYEADIKKSPPVSMDTSRLRKYRSFITMPVMVDSQPVGLLTINSTKKNGLTDEDIVPMRLLAELCSTAIATNSGKCPSIGA